MIGGINPGSTLSYQTGTNSPVRERSDAARLPASAPEKTAETARSDLADSPNRPVPERNASEAPERRVEARRALEDVRLERFRADEVPLPTARALSTFASVSAAGQESNGTALAGIDILV
ncbi:MAG TPA: UDP pyrophosphate phosphatase [Marinobacter sp.]|uniref:UDP pyrophosphate phosphatase n=2 Tax=root TaxID=1 RepID=A0A831R884_9GAMM|nr:UDP pyrophosphate phosphatase [Marinobacter antarcticus]HDZ37072.1 UDP pyrophosphate phosphatase [Marinobacter sp.]HEA54190.1 UDP pyrophosphate phosphatase [Marinobacter antarcticus]